MIKTYKDLKGRVWDGPGIPKWIFRTGNESIENLHSEIAKLYTTQLENNPGYELFYFNGEDRLQFINDLNDSDIETTYNKLIPVTYKVDLFKFAIVYTYGGICMDFSMESLISLDDIINGYKESLARDKDAPDGLCAGFIASVRQTTLLQKTIEKCVYNAQHNLLGSHPLDVTGPLMFSRVFKKLYSTEVMPLGKITDDMYLNDMADQVYIYNGSTPIIKIRSENHYSILYSDKKDKLYYGDLWYNNQVYAREIKTYKDLKGRKWGEGGIPKWIFRSGYFNLEELPEVIKLIYITELIDKNPEYELFYFSDKDCEQFIKEEWGEEYLELYNILIPTAYKADFFRYLLLYTYGGIWGDFTQIPLIPLNDFIKDVDRVFCMDRPAGDGDVELYNAIMMVEPNDKVVENAITISKGNILGRKYCDNPLDVTGPVVLGQAFRATKYHKSSFDTKILVGTYNKTKILLNPDFNPQIVDEFNNPVIIKKLGNHVDILYKSDNKHYFVAWIDKTVFNY